MRRIAALIVCCAVAAAAVAAPAPLPRRATESGPWFAGWDPPQVPEGGGEFVRKGDALSILLPGSGPLLPLHGDPPKVPRLTRKVKGDFTLTVRVTADGVLPADRVRGAGLVLLSRTCSARIQLVGQDGHVCCVGACSNSQGHGYRWISDEMPPEQKGVWLRTWRRGTALGWAVSADGKRWHEKWLGAEFVLEGDVEVGVFANASARGPFEARFDQLEFAQGRQ